MREGTRLTGREIPWGFLGNQVSYVVAKVDKPYAPVIGSAIVESATGDDTINLGETTYWPVRGKSPEVVYKAGADICTVLGTAVLQVLIRMLGVGHAMAFEPGGGRGFGNVGSGFVFLGHGPISVPA